MPFYLHHSRIWATSWYSLYHFPLKRAPTIFLYFDTSSINSPCFAPFALCLALFLQIRDKWTSNDSETNLTKEISNLPCNPLAFVGFFPALIIFHRIFWIFLQDKTRKISQWEKCEKLLVMCLNGVQSSLQHLTTYLYYFKSYF